MRISASIVVLAIIFVLVGVMAAPLFGAGEKSAERETEQLRTIIDKALVQCYALEGSYPPDLQYLQTNYGVVLDEKKYLFIYETGGMSNIKPEFYIQPNQREKAKARR